MHFVLYRSDHCSACRKLSVELRRICEKRGDDVEEKDVTEHIEEAARLGITHPPAVVVNGRVIGQGAGALVQLRRHAR